MFTLEQAISYHLQGSFYPPLPQAYVAPAVEAVSFMQMGEYEVLIPLPSDLNPLPRTAKNYDGEWFVTASDLFESLRLDSHKFGDLVADYED